MENRLELRGLTKRFGKRIVVDELDLDVRAGEILGFLGPNGAGKTTTIKMILGFLFEDAGTITIDGHDLRRDYERALSSVGGIVENPEMYVQLTGRQNLELYARLHGVRDRARIDEVIRLVGMEQRINEKVRKYSLGMKQRTGLALAIVHRPRLLILDEPTNGLDPAGIRHLRDILKRLAHEEGVAILVSSHLLSEMQLMCDRVAIIDQGRLIAVRMVHELETAQDLDMLGAVLGADAAAAATDAAGGRVDDYDRTPPPPAPQVPVWRIDVAQPGQAAAALEAAGLFRPAAGDRVELPRSLHLAIEPQAMLQVQQTLLANGHVLLQLRRDQESLEEAFLKLTANSRIE
ncbi:MAG: ABC transporter ATP-binding protein [Bacillota bacterium]|nr:ABC transporter ATP-binding protein [Bacillota bacterium]